MIASDVVVLLSDSASSRTRISPAWHGTDLEREGEGAGPFTFLLSHLSLQFFAFRCGGERRRCRGCFFFLLLFLHHGPGGPSNLTVDSFFFIFASSFLPLLVVGNCFVGAFVSAFANLLSCARADLPLFCSFRKTEKERGRGKRRRRLLLLLLLLLLLMLMACINQIA